MCGSACTSSAAGGAAIAAPVVMGRATVNRARKAASSGAGLWSAVDRVDLSSSRGAAGRKAASSGAGLWSAVDRVDLSSSRGAAGRKADAVKTSVLGRKEPVRRTMDHGEVPAAANVMSELIATTGTSRVASSDSQEPPNIRPQTRALTTTGHSAWSLSFSDATNTHGCCADELTAGTECRLHPRHPHPCCLGPNINSPSSSRMPMPVSSMPCLVTPIALSTP